MSDEDLRDCFAMFAMLGILKSYSMAEVFEEQPEFEFKDTIAKDSYRMADAMLKARKAKDETGIVAVKRSSTKKEK